MVQLEAGSYVARWFPEHGMVCASLTHEGGELLGQRGGLDAYLAQGSAFGIPLLAPWANRLDGLSYGEVRLDPAKLKLDLNGLPKDGVMAGRPWQVVAAEEDRLVAAFTPDQEVLASFPFPCRWEVTAALDPDGLTVTTALQATGSDAVPVSFGWHPLFTLPGVDRDAWEIHVPGLAQSVLDPRGIPTGAVIAPDGNIDDTEFRRIDGAFRLCGGGQELRVSFGMPDFPVGHVWAPRGKPFVAWEPMTAPTNALCSGDGLRWLAPDDTFTASFRVSFRLT